MIEERHTTWYDIDFSSEAFKGQSDNFGAAGGKYRMLYMKAFKVRSDLVYVAELLPHFGLVWVSLGLKHL